MNINEFKLDLQAVLEKVKSIANIKRDINIIESKLPKIKLQGTLNSTSTRKELNTKLKSVNPKVKIDADTTLAEKKMRKLNQQKTNPTITPTVDNSQVVSGLKQAQEETQTLWDKFTNGIFGINLIRRGVQEVVQVIRQAIVNIKELDAIKTNIQMVSGASDSAVNAMMSDYNSMAKDLSSTTKEVAEAANEFLRMGESVASTNELIKSSQVLSKVGMIESAESASYLISSLKGYQIAAENSMDVVSKLTSVDLEAAVSAGGLAEALSKCSNIANNSGVAIDRLIGYTATVGEVTQKSMSEVGNSFQSLLSRMNNIKIGRFIDDETGESLSDTEAVLNKLGIQLRDTEDSYRSFDDVLDDIGNRWNDFTKVEQNAISVAIAGTRQRENFESLMNNYGDALKYSETAANSAGSALERYRIYQDSIRAKTNELTAAMESLSTNAISEELFSGIIEATTGVVEFIDEANILKGTLAGIVTMGVSKAFVSMATGIIAASKSTAQLTAAMALFDKGRSKQNLLAIGAACKGLSDQQLKLVLSTKGLTNVQRQRILVGMGVKDAELQQTLATLGFAEAENVATVSTFSFKGALNSLMTAIMMNPLGALVTAVTAVTIAFSVYKQHQEELIQATQESANAYKESTSSIEDYTKRYQELYQALLEAKGNEEETYNIKQQLLDLQTELNDKFGEEYGKLNLVTDAYKDQTEAIKALNKETANKTLNDIGDKGINDAKSQMLDKKKYNLGMDVSLYSDEGIAIQELADKYGIDINTSEGSGTFSLILKADATTAERIINDFMTDVRNLRDNGDFDFTDSFDSVLDYSGSELKRVKDTIEQLGDALQQILIAEIIKDDDELARKYNNALETVEALNEAVLKSEDPFNDENVQKLRQDLEALKGTFTTEELENYGYVLYDVFEQADTKLIDFHNELKNNSELQKLADNLRGLDNLDLESLNPGENASFDKLKESADEYKLSLAELIDELVRLGYVQGEIKSSVSENDSAAVLSITQTINQLNTQIKPAFDSLKSAWQDIFTNEGFKLNSIDILSTCDSIKSKLDEMSEAGLSIDYSAFEDFVQVLNNAEATEQDVKDAFDGLASSITSAGLSGAEDFETLKSALEDLGIINDELVAFEALISNTEVLKEKGLDLANATEEQIRSFAIEAVSAENLEQAIAMLTFQKELCALQGMDTSGEVANLLTLAENAGYTGEVIQYLTELEQLYQQVASGTLTPGQLDAKLARAEELQNLIKESASRINYEPKVDFSNVGGGKSGASKAAKEAADAYLESFEDELKSLKDLKDAGVITEKQYLDRLRALYVKYFKDKKQYAEEYAKYEREYLNGMKSLYESVFAHFISKINDRIKGIEDEKDAAVDALEEEKDAAEAAYQAEIDAIEKANKARERQLDLQQKQYNLEKLMNQKTVLLYSEGRGMHYENDTSGARKARDEVEKAKDEIRVAELEEMIEKSNAYYDELIEQTEKYYDTLSDALEKQKSKFEELQDLLDQAQMQAVLKELGINEEELLAGSEKEFNKLRDSYIGILADLNAGNNDVLSALSELSGMASLPSYLGETVNTVNALADSAGSLNSSLSGIDASAVNSDFDNMAASSSNAAGKVQSVTDALNNLTNDVSNYTIPSVNSDNFVSSFAEDGEILTTLTGFVARFKEICSDIPNIWDSTLSEAFGEGGGSGDPLAGGLSNDTKYDTLFEPILTALDTCKAAMEEKLKECTDTWVQFQTDLSEIIGVSGGSSDSEGGKGTSAGAGQGTGKQEESVGTDTIVGAIQEGGALIDESLNGEEGWAASFITAQGSIHGTAVSIVECIESMVQEIVNACIAAIEAINMLERAKGGKRKHPTPQPYGRVGHSHGQSGKAHEKGTVGNAFATGTGYRGLPEAEKNALRSENGQIELTLYPDGTTEITNKPIMSDLPKGTIIFNEEQTKQILNGKPYMRGKINKHGAVKFENDVIVRPNGDVLTPLPDDHPIIQAQKKFEAYMMKMGGIETATKAVTDSIMSEHNKEVDKFISQLNAGNVITNNKNVQPNITNEFHITMPNVTNSTAAETLMRDLQSLRIKKYQVFD